MGMGGMSGGYSSPGMPMGAPPPPPPPPPGYYGGAAPGMGGMPGMSGQGAMGGMGQGGMPQGAMGEVVGRSPAMMTGYHGRRTATSEAEWHDAEGNRYIRHGDIGRFDEDGFLTLMDRKKDLIISGGFNIYPSDLEAVLRQHPAVADCSVIFAVLPLSLP